MSWVCAKPKPQNCHGESWHAYLAVALECCSKLVRAGHLAPRIDFLPVDMSPLEPFLIYVDPFC